MPAITVPVGALSFGPGYLYWAPLATAVPTNTVAGSVFTDVWAAAWIPLGATQEGHELSTALSTDQAYVAEYLDAVSTQTTSRVTTMSLALANTTLNNLKRTLNGGTITTVSGTGATTLSSYTAPAVGAETRAMIGWESTAGDERFIGHQAFSTGTVTERRRKGVDFNVYPVEFTFEVPASGIAWTKYTAGTVRVGT